MARYRTPRKKTTNWKGLLGAAAMGVVLVALGVLLLQNLPDPGEDGAGTPVSEITTGVRQPAEGGTEQGDADTVPADDGPAPAAAQTRVSGAILGVGLVLLGLILPVGVWVIDKTSGKKWNRRAGKKHPWKRKI